MDNEYKISLGVELDTSNLQSQVDTAGSKIKPIDIKVDAETKELTNTIKEALKTLSSGTKNVLTIDTSKLEGSLNEVKNAILDIKNAFGSLGDKSGMQSLLSSVNQIATTIGKVTDETETLVKSLNTLSKKDFNINFGVKLGGGNQITRNILGSNKARDEVVPQLKKQVDSLIDYYNKSYNKNANDLEALVNMVVGTPLNTGDFMAGIMNKKNSLFSRMSDEDKPMEQMKAYKEYIDLFMQAADIKGIDLTSVTSGFSKSADEWIKDVKKVQSGVNETEDSFEKLGQVFSSGIDGEKLSGQLDSLVSDLTEIKNTFKDLSSGISLEGLTQSFDRLSEVLEQLVTNATLVKNNLGDGLSSSTSNTGVEQIIQDEKELAQTSIETTNTVVQNEEKKQQAVKQTADAYDDVSNKKISDMNQSDTGLEDVENDLQEIIITADNTSDAVKSMRNAMSNMKFDNSSIDAITKDLEEMDIVIKKISSKTNGDDFDITVEGINNVGEAVTVLKRLKTKTGEFDIVGRQIAKPFDEGVQAAKRFKKEAETVKNIKFNLEVGKYDDDISKIDDKFNKLSNASDELRQSVKATKDALNEMEKAATPDSDGYINKEKLIEAEQNYARALETTNNLLRIQTREQKAIDASKKLEDDITLFQADIDSWMTKNSAATNRFGNELLELRAKAKSCDRVDLNHFRSELKRIDKEADKLGLKMQSLPDRIKTKFKEYSAYFSVAEVFMYVTQGLRDMFDQVVAIDSAMTELKKVTNETDASYNHFLSNAGSKAKELGTTIDGLVSSTADFARLGYGFEESQGLAEVANIYAVVGDDIDSVETATQSLISTLTAFKDEANGLSDSDFAMSTVDKMNEVSNNFAISSGGIGEALQRSASSMMAANNSLDETIALITAANTVVQDPDAVGRLMPTLKMAISVKLQRWTRPRKDFISIFTTHQLGRMCIFCAFK